MRQLKETVVKWEQGENSGCAESTDSLSTQKESRKLTTASLYLGVVDGAGPGVGGGGDGRGGVAGNVTGDARVGLDLGVGVGRHLDCQDKKVYV